MNLLDKIKKEYKDPGNIIGALISLILNIVVFNYNKIISIFVLLIYPFLIYFFKTKFALKYKILEVIIVLIIIHSILTHSSIQFIIGFIFFIWVLYKNPFKEN